MTKRELIFYNIYRLNPKTNVLEWRAAENVLSTQDLDDETRWHTVTHNEGHKDIMASMYKWSQINKQGEIR